MARSDYDLIEELRSLVEDRPETNLTHELLTAIYRVADNHADGAPDAGGAAHACTRLSAAAEDLDPSVRQAARFASELEQDGVRYRRLKEVMQTSAEPLRLMLDIRPKRDAASFAQEAAELADAFVDKEVGDGFTKTADRQFVVTRLALLPPLEAVLIALMIVLHADSVVEPEDVERAVRARLGV